MNLEQHLLIKIMEECNELAQRCSKALRFGRLEVQPDLHENPDQLDNHERIALEWADLLGAMELFGMAPSNVHRDAIDASVTKFRKYLDYSRAQGTLVDFSDHWLNTAREVRSEDEE